MEPKLGAFIIVHLVEPAENAVGALVEMLFLGRTDEAADRTALTGDARLGRPDCLVELVELPRGNCLDRLGVVADIAAVAAFVAVRTKFGHFRHCKSPWKEKRKRANALR